jgi:hypothetical protein
MQIMQSRKGGNVTSAHVIVQRLPLSPGSDDLSPPIVRWKRCQRFSYFYGNFLILPFFMFFYAFLCFYNGYL